MFNGPESLQRWALGIRPRHILPCCLFLKIKELPVRVGLWSTSGESLLAYLRESRRWRETVFGGRRELGDGQNCSVWQQQREYCHRHAKGLRGANLAIRELLPFSGHSVKGLFLLSQPGLQDKSLSHKNKNETTRCFARQSSCDTPCGLTSVLQVRKQSWEIGWTVSRTWRGLGVNLSWFDSRVYNNTS